MTDKHLQPAAPSRRSNIRRARHCGMLLSRNIAPAALWCVLVMSSLVRAAESDERRAMSDERAGVSPLPISNQQSAISNSAPPAQPLDADLATQAYVVIENWVARAAVPDQPLAIRASDVSGLAVTLRFQGLTIGFGSAMLDDPLSPLADPQPTDIMALARRAVQAAFDDAQSNLTQLAVNRQAGPMPKNLPALAPLLQLDLQIAKVPQRIALDSLADLPARITLDAHGLALRDVASNRWTLQFPGQSLAANLSLQAQLNRLLAGLNMNPTQLPTIGTPQGPQLHRFDVVQIVRINADQPPLSLHRGQVVLPPRALDMQAITDWSGQWADQLISRLDDEGRFVGTYEPSLNQCDPTQAPPADAALACYALAAYNRSPQADPQRAIAAAHAAQRGLTRLLIDLGASTAVTQAAPTLIPTTQDSALTLLALLECPGNSSFKSQRDRLASWLMASFTPDKGFRGTPHIQSTFATPPVQAAAALALVRMYDQTREPRYLQTAKAALSLLWTDAIKRRTDALMPWAALAEYELAKLGEPTPGLLLAQTACQSLWQQQIQPNDPSSSSSTSGGGGSADIIGGFRTPGQLFDEPTWLSAGPLVALADALPVKNFINDEDRPAWIVNVSLGLRFCAQLTMTRQSAYYVQNRQRAVGAVRNSCYDNRQPTAATAYALLAASEFQKSLSAMAKTKQPRLK
ncbi:MAG: hypothetical protein ACYC26_16275 [Phycisphaerales bacterium]